MRPVVAEKGTRATELLVERPPEDVPSQRRGLLRRQRDRAEDDTDTSPIEAGRHRRAPGAPARLDRQVKDRVELAQQLGVEVESVRLDAERIEEAGANRRHAIGPRLARRVDRLRRQQPAARWGLAGGVATRQDVLPKLVQRRRAWE